MLILADNIKEILRIFKRFYLLLRLFFKSVT
jgi:hypothetical protein